MIDARLKSFVDRIEHEEEDLRERRKGVREIYDEAKDAQYNTKALRKLIAERRQKDREEIAEAMDGYRHALGMVAASVRRGELTLDQAQAESGFSRSAIHREASHQTQNAVSGTAAGIGHNSKPVTPCWAIANSIVATEAEAARLAEEARIAERERKRAERERLRLENARIDADPLTIPPFLRRAAA